MSDYATELLRRQLQGEFLLFCGMTILDESCRCCTKGAKWAGHDLLRVYK